MSGRFCARQLFFDFLYIFYKFGRKALAIGPHPSYLKQQFKVEFLHEPAQYKSGMHEVGCVVLATM